MAISSSVKCLAALLAAAAVVLPQVQGTAPLVDSVEWTLLENTQCGTSTLAGTSDEALQFDNEADAKAACEALGSDCFGVYDMACSGDTFFLCDASKVQTADDLGFSSSSCTSEMTIITATATTTTITTTAAPETTAAAAAATTAAATATAAVTIEVAAAPPPEGEVTLVTTALPNTCDQTCTLLDGNSELTCREQILSFEPPSEDTGSMPALEMTCENKRALVSAQGTCQECSGCDVCETTLADTRLWKISDGAKAFQAAGSRWGATPLVAGAAVFVGALLVGAAVVQRRLGWEHLRQQPEEA